MHHQMTSDPLAALLQQRSLAGELEGAGLVVVLVEDPGAPAHQVGHHLLPLLPHRAPEGAVTLPVPGLKVRPVVQQVPHTLQLASAGRTDQSCLPSENVNKWIVFIFQ